VDAGPSPITANTVPKGYRQTGAGIVPEDWEVQPLGALFSFKNGLNKGKEFFGHGTPIVNYMDVYSYSGLRSSDIRGRVDVSRQELDAFCVRRGDVFFTRTSETVDEIGIASVLLEESPDTVFSGFVLRGRPKNDVLIDAFKRYCFSSRVFRAQIISKSTYTTRALTNGRVLSGIALALPPNKAEQEAIAETLSDADTLIESLHQLIAKKRQIKQGAIQTLLTGKKRLLGFLSEDGFKQSELGLIPCDWVVRTVASFGDVITGSTPSTTNKAYWDGEFPWITPTDISVSRDIFFGDRSITRRGLKSVRALPADSVLVTCIASIGKNAVLKMIGSCNQQINAVIANEGHNPIFLYYLFEGGKDRLLGAAGTTATTMISKVTFKQIRFAIPAMKKEQEAIANILSDMDAELAELETRLTKTRLLKQGMVHALLTGRIRLPRDAAA